MNPPTDKGSFLLPAILGIALLLLGVVAGARMMGLLPNSIGGLVGIRTIELPSAAAESGNPSHAPSTARARRRCPECGVIVSMREIDAHAPTANRGATDGSGAIGVGGMQGSLVNRYEFVVRMEGGARRVIIDTVATRWREGDRVIVIDGANPAPQ